LAGVQPLAPIQRRYVRRDGGEALLEIHDSLVRNAAGEIAGIRSALLDVTERKRVEEALRESERQFRELFESSSDALFLLAADTGQIIEANNMASALFGYSRDELLTRKSTDMSAEPEETRQCTQETRTKPGQVFKIPLRLHRRKDGTVFPVDITARSLIRKGQAVLLVSSRDITERRRAEEALRASEARFDQLAEQSGTVAWEVDAQGLYTYVSHVSEAVWGYHSAELEGRMHFYDLHPEQGREAFKTAAFAVFDRKEPFQNLVNAVERKDGRLVWVSINGLPLLNPDGTLRGYRGGDTDVTERKRAEEELREKEYSLRESQVIAGLGSYILDIPTGSWKSSAVLDEVFGIDAAYEHTVEGWVALIHSGDRTTMADYLRNEVIGQGRTFDKEYRIIRHRDQAERWVYGLGKLDFDTHGRPLSMRGTIQDITERKRMGEELRAKEHLLSESQRIAHVGSWSWDLTNGISALQWSPETYRLHGVSPDTFVPSAETFLSLIHPDDRSSMQAWLGACLAGEEPPGLEFRTNLPDGSVRYIHGYGNLVRDAENKPIRMVGVAQDITERKRAEEEIRASKEEFDRFFALIPDLAAVASADGFFKKLNPAWEKTLGFSIAELLSRPLESFILPDDVLTTRQEILSQVNGEGTTGFVNRYRTKAGGYRWVEWMATPVVGGSWLYATGRDITERKQAEERINRYLEDLESAREVQEKNSADLARMVEQLAVEKDRAEAATRAKSEFLSSMSHEIRTPMNGVIGMTGLLLDTPLSPEQQGYAEVVRTSGESLLGIINNILDLSKIEAGKLDLEVVPFNLHNALKDVVELLAVAAREKNLE
ncbi:MAG: PAS domain S-box protein, partial [Bryobacterales bacterium]|nr:PAS domain S-box protein [Bryobacterales bacterium]